MSEIAFSCPFGEFELRRYPARKNDLLRAWDAADEHLLNFLFEQSEYSSAKSVLVVNDAFGALCVALHAHSPTHWSDSWLAQQACRENLQANGLEPNKVNFVPSLELPAGEFSMVLLKLPKSLALLDYQLTQLKHQLKPGTPVLLAGMVKSMPSTLWSRIETFFGATQTSRSVKKSKLITVQINPELPDPPSAAPCVWSLQVDATTLELFNHPNVFAREGLDIGARFFIEHLPASAGQVQIADLGCGNGVLGLLAAAQNPSACVHFIDESWMAVDSARRNLAQISQDAGCHAFHVGDGLSQFAANSLDRVLCNPPFHQQHAIGDAIALSMFREAARCLTADGDLWVIGNRHLDYHRKLTRWFKKVECVASNPKFVLLRAVQRAGH